MASKHFTLEEANALLPKVSSHLRRALQLHVLVRSGTEELANEGYRVTRDLLAHEPESEDDNLALARTRALYAAMLEEVETIRSLGAEVKGVEQGLVDFWSWLDGEQEVLLCWKLGESEIQHYHAPEAGFAGRKPVSGHRFTREPTTSQPANPEH
jgi:hypothetical protein